MSLGALVFLVSFAHAADISEINGSWASGCYPNIEDGEITSNRIMRLEVSDGDFNLVTEAYGENDLACEGAPAIVFTADGRFWVEKMGKSGKRLISGKAESFQLRVNRRLWVTWMNLTKVCGMRGWKAGTTRDLTGKTCKGFGKLEKGQSLYQIYQLVDGKLRLGVLTEERNGATEETRPDELANETLERVGE